MGLKTGQVLSQRYEIKKQLGMGGNAHVYLACDIEDGRNRAIKEISKSLDSPIYEFVRREADIVRKLNYPYFPQIIDILHMEKADYIVMEYLQGETAGERLRRLGPQPAGEVVRWAKDLCLMLNYLHSSIPPMVYCDLKPDNIMIQPTGNLRLIDFGAVLELEQESGSSSLCMGTKGYAAPEQFDGGKAIDARTDIYGLGRTMYELLTGKDPCRAAEEEFSVRNLRHFMPRRLAQVIRTCTWEEPAKRYPSCEELREDLIIVGKA